MMTRNELRKWAERIVRAEARRSPNVAPDELVVAEAILQYVPTDEVINQLLELTGGPEIT